MSNLYVPDDRPLELARTFSGLPNPWAGIQTYETFPAGEASPALRDAYREYGIVKLTGVLSRPEVARYLDIVLDLSGVAERDFADIAAGRKPNYVKPGVVGYTPSLWPLVDHPLIRPALDAVFGRPYGVINTSVGAAYSAPALHRDGDYFTMDPSAPHNLVDYHDNTNLQVLIPFTPPGRQNGRLGIIPFSHRKSVYDRKAAEIGVAVPFDFYLEHNAVKNRALRTGDLRPLHEIERYTVFVDTVPGDALLFDGRLLHYGELLTGPKYIAILSYSAEDDLQLERIGRMLRRHADGGDGDFPLPFREFLKARNLFWPRMEDVVETAVRERIDRLADLDRTAPVYIYGAGSTGLRCRQRLEALGFPPIRGFIDTERGGTFADLPVHALADYAALYAPDHQILIASQYYDAMERNLAARGIRKYHTVFHLLDKP